MSKKKADSGLPNEFLLTTGFNGGLDGFQFDTEYGAGVKDSARLPEAKGLSELPDGLTGTVASEPFPDARSVEGQSLGDLGEMLHEGSLAELGWLHGEQDPERLPVNPVDQGIQQLEEAWGRPKEGTINRLPYQETHAKTVEQKRASAGDLIRVACRAMRRSAYGQDLASIAKEAKEELGSDYPRILTAMKQVAAEHGLAGRVFIRASAFPGLRNGKWKDTIRRRCAGAKFIIAEKESPVGSIVGMEVVTSVPWKRAFAEFAPKMRAVGYKVAGGDPKESLRAAFRAGPVEPELGLSALKPVEKQADRKAPAPILEIPVKGHRIMMARRKKAHDWIREKLATGRLSQVDAGRLVASEKAPEVILKEAALLVAASEKGAYGGSGLNTSDAPVAKKAEQQKKASIAKFAAWLENFPKGAQGVLRYAAEAMNEGLMGSSLDELLAARFAEPNRDLAKSALQELRARHEGLAGVAYVDSGAYVSKTGTAGCDRGALKHRGNTIPIVLGTDRCASCEFQREVAKKGSTDSQGHCQKYGKILASFDGFVPEDMAALRAKNLRMAEATDAEITASLFAPSFDQQEYRLGAATDNIVLADEAELPDIGDIFFGGFEI